MKNANNNVNIDYDKVYTDDCSTHIPSLFNDYPEIEHISVNRMWPSVIEGFYSVNHMNYLCCIKGNVRIVIANDQGNNNWKFNQYFISEMDGKIIEIRPNTWFAVNNMLNEPSMIITGTEKLKEEPKVEKMSPKIFNWYSKR